MQGYRGAAFVILYLCVCGGGGGDYRIRRSVGWNMSFYRYSFYLTEIEDESKNRLSLYLNCHDWYIDIEASRFGDM